MNQYLFVLLVIFAGITPLTLLISVILWKINFKKSKEKPLEHYPPISILVAARNEENNLQRCIESLLALNYPPDKVHILIGNDDSSDNTLAIARSYENQADHITVVDIKEKVGNADAKANVLAQLITADKYSSRKADYYLITDADVAVNPEWARSIITSICNDQPTRNTGIITGVTLIEGPSLWAKLQCLDWTLGLGLVKVLSDLSMPVTTMGNNMLVTREAYDITGGYEEMPFSVTEDFALFHTAFQKGFKFRNLIDGHVLAWAKPIPTVGELLQQRKRWMYGAIQLPFYIVLLLILIGTFYPIAAMVWWQIPLLGITLIAAKWFFQIVFFNMIMTKLYFSWKKKSILLTYFFAYEIYSSLLIVSTVIFYYLPIKMKWKGRSFA